MSVKHIAISMLFFSIMMSKLTAQNDTFMPNENGGELSLSHNSAENPCISSQEYEMLEKRCNENAKLFVKEATTQKTLSTALNWPLRAAANLKDCGHYYISAHVDHDNTTAVKDYNCGTIVYNGHGGTDIAIGPFPFHKMDSSQVEVIAAADGIILDKHDGEFDKNCTGVSSTAVANYVVIQHADGSRAFYYHLKKNSLTSKAIGQAVVTGEFLGVVGSSGYSSGPHLHFEIWSGSTSATRIDPFSGTCNLMNANSWWIAQKPYTEPAPLKASVHTTDIVIPNCPGTETINESASYTIPFQGAGLAAGYAKFYMFLRNTTAGETVTLSILNPNATVFNSWTHNCSSTSNFYYWGFSKLLPTTAGTYTFKATYNGVSCSQTFKILTSVGIDAENEALNGINLFPNPTNSSFKVQFPSFSQNMKIEIWNELGQNIRTLSDISDEEIEMNSANLRAGVYTVRIITENNQSINKRLIIKE